MNKGDKSLKKPVYDQKPLLIQCNCAKKILLLVQWFMSQQLQGGTCDRCTCLCMFVCSTTNYNAVSIAVMAKKSTSSDDSAERIDHAWQFLRGGGQDSVSFCLLLTAYVDSAMNEDKHTAIGGLWCEEDSLHFPHSWLNQHMLTLSFWFFLQSY